MHKKYFKIIIGSLLLLFVFNVGVSVASAADELSVAPLTSGTDNLIGAINASWVFTATTTNTINAGEIVQFVLPSVSQATAFVATTTTIVATSSNMVGVFNLYPTNSTPTNDLAVAQGPSGPVIYGYATTSIPGGKTFSITISGITNAAGQISSLQNLQWTVKAGVLSDPAQPAGNLSSTRFTQTATRSLVRGGGSLVSDLNSSVSQSSYVTGAAATTTFVITLASALPAGSKIGINFPPDFNLQNAAVPVTQNIATGSAAQVAVGAIATTTGAGLNRVILTTSNATVAAGNAITVAVGGLTNPSAAGVFRPFTLFTMKANSGLLDGSYFGFENSDFSTGAPPPLDTLHIGGKNTLIVTAIKQNSDQSTSTLSASERAQVKVGVGCPDKQFFMGQRWLDASSKATYGNVLDCNYMVGVDPFNKGTQSIYDSLLPPGMKMVNLVAGSDGQTATATLVFSVPTATTTLKLTGGVAGTHAFIHAFSADNESMSDIFTDTTYTTSGFDGSGNGYAKVRVDIGKNWNFNVEGGSFGSVSGIADSNGAKRWPPTIPSVNITATSAPVVNLDIGSYAYVLADKNLLVTLAKSGGGTINDACVGVMRSGGGVFTPPQDMICQPNYDADNNSTLEAYRFKVPAGAISVQINRMGFGAPAQYPVAVSSSVGTTTMPTITLSSPSSYISVSVSSSGGGTTSPISGAPIFAHGPNGSANGMTDSSGTATLYVSPGTYTVEGFAPAFGPLTAQSTTVTSGSNPSVSFTVNTGSLRTISGRVTQGSIGVSGINIGAHGTGSTSGGNNTQTDALGNYTLYVPSGTYELGGWSPSTGGLDPLTADVTSGNATGKNWSLGASGTLHVEIQNASNISPLFVGAFSPTTGKGNGTDSWTGSSTSKVTDISLPAGTYEVHAGSPSLGEIGSQSSVTITAGSTETIKFNAQSSVTLVTLSGTVTSGGSGVSGINVWASRVNGPGFFSTQTASDGTYSLKVPTDITYRMGVRSLAYIPDQGDISVAVSGNTTKDFTLSAAGSTITGTIKNSSGTGIANAWVTAIKTGLTPTQIGAPTDSSGAYTLNIDTGSSWNITAEGPCYLRSSQILANAGATEKNITLSANSGCSVPVPSLQSITDTSGGQISKSDIVLNIPANALGTSQSSVSVSVSDAATVVSSANATPLKSSVKSITATDSSGQSVTSLNSNASLVITYDPSELPNGFDETKIQLAYFDTTQGQWEPVAATVDTDNNTLTASVSHFTDYGPILPGVPDAPTGLSATADSSSQISLSWTASPTATSYIIYRSATDSNFTTSIASGITTTSYSDSSLTANRTYYYEVAGVNDSGEGSNSSSANATTNAASSNSSGSSSASGGGLPTASNLTLVAQTTPSPSPRMITGPLSTYAFSRSLQFGMSGLDVTALQTFLEEQGLLVIPPAIGKGYFGRLTEEALIKFQKKSGIVPAVGFFGPVTRAHLSKTVQPTAGASAPSTTFSRDLEIGDDGSDVVSLQTYLEQKGYLVIPPGIAKGYFGAKTREALRLFQMEAGITPTGNLGPITRGYILTGKK